MNGLITTNEPKDIKRLFPDLIQCPMAFDIKLYTKSGPVCIERKKVPGDLLSSVSDGRLFREILAMREEGKINVVIIHGKCKYNRQNQLMLGNNLYPGKPWTRRAINNIIRTIQYVEQCYVEFAEDRPKLYDVVEELQDYLDKSNHVSMRCRESIQTQWIHPTYEERVIHFYDGLPGISVVIAKSMAKFFPTPLMLYGASIEQIEEVPKIGKQKATVIYNFLRGESIGKAKAA